MVEHGIEIIDATVGVCRVLIDDSVTVEPGTIQGLLDVFDTNGHKLSVLKFSMIVDEVKNSKLSIINNFLPLLIRIRVFKV